MSTNKNPKICELRCGHHQSYFPPPHPMDLVYCFKCDDYVFYGKAPVQYHFNCCDCRAGRNYGQDRAGVERSARNHYRNNPGHTVCILYGNAEIKRISENTVRFF